MSGLLVLGGPVAFEVGSGGDLASGQTDPTSSSLETIVSSKDLTLEAESSSVPMTREEIRTWIKGLGLPEMRPAYVRDERAIPLDSTGLRGIITPQDANEVVMHKADLAHTLGFDGTGVRVAVIDTGIDFAHPDLYNVTARDENPSSDYFLHPIMYDGGSLNDYLVFGTPSPTFPFGDNYISNSWYVNTSYSTTVGEFPVGKHVVNWTDGVNSFTWDVTNVSGLVAGEEVRVGFHPDDKFLFNFGVRPAIILFNSTGTNPPFNAVIADLDTDMSMDGEKEAYINTDWGTFNATAEVLHKDIDGDGVQDISGGIVYFIADGVRELPYASRQVGALNFTFQTLMNDDSFDIWAEVGVNPMDHLVPGMGDLVALFGDFEAPVSLGSHGTWVTSAIVGQGITGGGTEGPVLLGMAPGAKIIGSGNNFGGTDPFGQMGLYTALIFATEGYDGLPGTEDEAHIASNSWGGADWTGWDWSSRFADYVSTVMAEERTLFVFAAGNAGPGYGGRSTPAGGASLLVAGSMENFLYRVDPWYGFDGGPNATYGDVTGFSNRGPSAMGRHYVDTLTSGHFGYGADPLNDNPFTLDGGTDFNGSASWILWAGTSLATPNLSGVTALIYHAYMAAHGGPPLASQAKTIVKNSADDAHQDPFLVGAGIANAWRGVLIANETQGIATSLHEWNPGNYSGVVYGSFANLLFPGEMDMVVVSVTNHNQTQPSSVTVEDAVMATTASISMDFTRVPNTAPAVFLLNDTGILAADGTMLVPAPPNAYSTADAIRLSLWFSRGRLAEFPRYLLDIFDWNDSDSSGTFESPGERNLMFRDVISFDPDRGPNGFGFIYDPANRTQDGMAIWLNPLFEGLLTSSLAYTMQVDYYKRTDFLWLDASPTTMVIPAGGSAPLALTVNVPGDADPGLYEAVVLLSSGGSVTTLPVVVNVASPLPMSFGGSAYDSGPYQQGVQYGTADTLFYPISSGDYRYYFTDLPEPANVTVTLEWERHESSLELYVLSNVTDWFSENWPVRYGPGTIGIMETVSVKSNATAFSTTMNDGLGIIVVRSTFIAGVDVAEHPMGQVGAFDINPRPWVEDGVPVDGSMAFSVTSEVGFSDVTFSGGLFFLPETVLYANQPVESYPYGFQDFIEYLYGAPNKLRTEITEDTPFATYTLFFHSGADDLDMGIFYDADCDGNYAVTDDVVGTVASTESNPEVATIDNPALGCYWVHAAGFDVEPSGGLYDLTLEVFIPQPIVFPDIIPETIIPFDPALLTVGYSLPHWPITFTGNIYLGSAQFPEALSIPFALTPNLPPEFRALTPAPGSVLGDSSVTISVALQDAMDAYETEVDPDSITLWLDGSAITDPNLLIANHTSVVLNVDLREGPHTVTVEAADTSLSQNRTSWSFTVDTTAPSLTITSPTTGITKNTAVTISGRTDSGVSVTVNGSAVAVGEDGTFSTDLTLTEGSHTLPVIATDAAGNSRTENVSIVVDITPPTLSLTSPTEGATVEVASVTITGTTEPGARVTVNGLVADVSASGAFSFILALVEGDNTITARATDPAGNNRTVSVTVTFANPVPGLEEDLEAADANLGFLWLLVYVLAAIAAVGAGLALFMFVLWWMGRKGA